MDYTSIFNQRARFYHEAMTQFPKARELEFLTAIEGIPDHSSIKLLDVPSGPDYLSSYFSSTRTEHMDTSDVFVSLSENKVRKINNITNLECESNSLDYVVSVAGLHHEDVATRQKFYDAAYQALKKNGKIIVLEVLVDTPTAYFLNNFVDSYNSEGHQGLFFEEDEYKYLKKSGFSINVNDFLNTPWQFDNIDEMSIFCKSLFNLNLATHSHIVDGIKEILGIQEKLGKIVMNWGLVKIEATKK